MTNAWFGQFEVFNQCLEPCPRIASPLTATVKPLQENRLGEVKIVAHTLVVAPDTVIIPVPPQLSVQFRKQYSFRQATVLAAPFLQTG